MKFSDPFHAAVPLNILNELVDLLSLLVYRITIGKVYYQPWNELLPERMQ